MRISTRTGFEGHPRGGPLVLGLCLLLALGACGGRGPSGRPVAIRDAPFARTLEIYEQMGLLAGPPDFPLVASLGTLAGPADSSYVLVMFSLPNSALRFQREGNGFAATYSVDVELLRDSVAAATLNTQETVRVGSFGETNRIEESIVFQQALAVAPGRYVVRLRVADVNSSRGYEGSDTIDVPAYGAQATRLAPPLLVYQAAGRAERAARPDLIPNARHSAAYGGESPRIYLEGYGIGEGEALAVRVLGEAGQPVWTAEARLALGDSALRHGIVEIPAGGLPLGRMTVEVAAAGQTQPLAVPLVLSISEQWMIANFEDVLGFLRYIAYPEEIDSLEAATPVERRQRWDTFWARRDPLPATGTNEYRDQFFERVRYATEAFREPGGRAGWDTDRGEVYIVLGPPTRMMERYIGIAETSFQPNAEEWYFASVPGGSLSLLFVDRSGLGRFELVPGSQAAFRSVADRMRPRRR